MCRTGRATNTPTTAVASTVTMSANQQRARYGLDRSQTESSKSTDSSHPAETNNLEKPTTDCPECSCESFTVDETNGEVTCNDCDTVIDEVVFYTDPNWSARSTAKHREDTTTASNTETGLQRNKEGGHIDYADKGPFGTLSAARRAKITRLRIRNREASADDNEFRVCQQDITRITGQLGVPYRVQEKANEFCETILQQVDTEHYSLEAIAAVALAKSLEIHSDLFDIEDILDYTAADNMVVTETYDRINGLVDTGKGAADNLFNLALSELAPDIHVGDTAVAQASTIRESMPTGEFQSFHSDRAQTATALYVALLNDGSHVSQGEIAAALNIEQSALRDCYSDLTDLIQASVIEGNESETNSIPVPNSTAERTQTTLKR